MTLNGVMAVILRYFSEFAYLPGVLRKSSRSLSHLLMSFCLSTDPMLLTQAFTAYVRPMPEYCSPVWSPSILVTLIN